MERPSKRWSRSSSGNLWLPEPTRRTVLTGAGAAALLLGCGRDDSGIGSISTGGTGGAGAGSGGAGGTGAGAGTGGSTSAPDAATAGGADAGVSADSMLESDGLFIAPDGSVIPVDGATPSAPDLKCTKRSQQIVGPFPAADVQLNRSDIRSDPADGDKVKPGVPLQVVIRVGTKGMMGCSPVQGAVVNAWQCDAAGVYASYASQGTARNQYLRGYQATDGSGVVVFQTIYPGSYAGRCVHFHFSVRMSASQNFPNDAFVGQLYFPDEITDDVLTQAGYSSQNRVRNAQDGFYKPDMLGTVTRLGAGYLAELELAI
jgi:protocatechuate 3,4-dioxygenase beta subunit